MPYIDGEAREDLDNALSDLGTAFLWYREKNPGFLNYVLTRLILRWLGNNPNYAKYNEAVGVLECVKLEFYRRAVSAYEDEKINQNGDVYK